MCALLSVSALAGSLSPCAPSFLRRYLFCGGLGRYAVAVSALFSVVAFALGALISLAARTHTPWPSVPSPWCCLSMFSEDTRQHVLGLLDELYDTTTVADIIKCSRHSMRRWVRHFRQNKTVWCDPRLHKLHGDAAKRNPDLTRAMLTLVAKETASFLRDHVNLLLALRMYHPTSNHRYVSAATVYHALRLYSYTRKRIERLYLESPLQAQKAFALLIDEIPFRYIMSCDETHTGGGDLLLRYGRSQRNVPCVLRDRDTRPLKRTSSMMGASMTRGALWSQTVVLGSAQTSDDWRLSLQCLHTRMITYIPGLAWEM